ncbi:MAG: YdgA family protein [Gammaproteobacteria bacterium]|nr:YdgA family protein [Gammaproteobacteria bacterium]
MKKLTLILGSTLIALVALAALALPYWFGMETEKTYAAMLEQLSSGSGLQFTGKNYQRGWLSSTAETVIRHPQIPIEFTAQHRISHGPLPLDRMLQGDWRLTPVQARIASLITLATAGQQKPLNLPTLSTETTFRLNGGGTVHAEISPIKTTGAKGETIDWRGMNADMTFDRAWRKIRFDALMPSLTVTTAGQQGDMTLSKLSLHSDTQEGIAGYSFGDASLNVGQLEFSNAAVRAGFKGFALSSTARPTGDNVNLVIRYTLDEVQVAEEHLGPGQLVIEARNLDAAALVKFKNEIDALTRGNLPPAQASMIVAGKAMELIAVLSKKAPEVEITRLSFKTREGEISGKGKFVLDGRKRDIAQNPMQMLTAFAGDLELAIPGAVLKRLLTPQIRQDIAAYRQSGALTADDVAHLSPEAMAEIVDRVFPQYLARNDFTRLLVEESGVYKLKLTIRQGQLLINGKPWHVPTQVALAG